MTTKGIRRLRADFMSARAKVPTKLEIGPKAWCEVMDSAMPGEIWPDFKKGEWEICGMLVVETMAHGPDGAVVL